MFGASVGAGRPTMGMELLNLRYRDERRARRGPDGIGRTGTEGPGPRRGTRRAYVALVAGARWGWARAERAAQVSYAREDPVSLPPRRVGHWRSGVAPPPAASSRSRQRLTRAASRLAGRAVVRGAGGDVAGAGVGGAAAGRGGVGLGLGGQLRRVPGLQRVPVPPRATPGDAARVPPAHNGPRPQPRVHQVSGEELTTPNMVVRVSKRGSLTHRTPAPAPPPAAATWCGTRSRSSCSPCCPPCRSRPLAPR